MRRSCKIPSIVFFLILPVLAWAQANAWKGKCVGVSDGDTITVMHEGKGEKIRLYGVDCPEKKQAFGKRAKKFTSNMVFGKDVEVRPVTTDRYARTIAWTYVNGTCVNEELLKAGFAWHYKRYSPDTHLAELETEARQKKAGLWADTNPLPPWSFRRGTISVTTSKPKAAAESMGYRGNVESKKFHAPSCRYYESKRCTAVFQRREEAVRSGYVPCGICKP